MKRLGLVVILLIIVYSIYYDLTIGTLPDNETYATNQMDISSQPQDSEPIEPIDENFTMVTVEPGHTVLSIVERLHEGPIPASIQEIIYDFKVLNDGIKPEEIRIGEIYLFPLYP